MQFLPNHPYRTDFMGNPIVFQVQESPLVPNSSYPISFHQVHLVASIRIDGTPVGEYELSQNFTGNTPKVFDFDISSCFRAAADTYEYEPVTTAADRHFPTFTASIYAYASYMQNGVRIEKDKPTYPNNDQGYTITTHLGCYSDFERHQSTAAASLITSLTRKPVSSPEVVFPGDTILYAHLSSSGQPGFPSTIPSDSSDSPIFTTSAHPVPLHSEGTSIAIEGHSYYVSHRRRHSVCFQFVNSRGCIESIRAFTLPAEKGAMSQTEHIISRFERFSTFSRILNSKQQRPTEFSMTSGPVDYQWARWWYYEFCQSERVWMLIDDHNPLVRNAGFPQIPAQAAAFWLPVIIKPSDSSTLIDHTKTDLLTVDFTMLPDINGPLF